MESSLALRRASSWPRSATAATSTYPNRRIASTCAGPMKPVPMMPALIFFMVNVTSSIKAQGLHSVDDVIQGVQSLGLEDYSRISTLAQLPDAIDLSTASSTATHCAPSWKSGTHG